MTSLSATLRSDRPNATTVSVSFRDGLLSVEAKAGTWMQVLNEVTEQTGIRFHHSLPFAGSVTVSFANLPVRQAIERLFRVAPSRLMFLTTAHGIFVSLRRGVGTWERCKVEVPGDNRGAPPRNNAGVDSNQAHVGMGRADKLAAAGNRQWIKS